MSRYLLELAMAMLEMKYPSEMNDRKYTHGLFDIYDMMVEELYNKNWQLFVRDYLNQLEEED